VFDDISRFIRLKTRERSLSLTPASLSLAFFSEFVNERYVHERHAHERHAYERHAHGMHVHEMHAHEMHAYERHAYERHAMRGTPMTCTPMRCTLTGCMPAINIRTRLGPLANVSYCRLSMRLLRGGAGCPVTSLITLGRCGMCIRWSENLNIPAGVF